MSVRRPRIEGYAVISLEGMIATSDGKFPEEIKIPADHKFYQDSVDRASAVANGRHSAEGGPKEKQRRRLVLTRRVEGVAVDPANPLAVLWNPGSAPFDDAWARLGIDGGSLAVVGGTDVFGLFLSIGYDAFYLSRTEASVPKGRPVFPGVGRDGVTPAEVMGKVGLVLREARVLDAATNTVVEEWGPKG
ncbi:MAG: dihydrofolate reductase [Alphaproteobacteria bacterium]|nr:dihydrofolate reductase [Alphaproteobacteria bacterium]